MWAKKKHSSVSDKYTPRILLTSFGSEVTSASVGEEASDVAGCSATDSSVTGCSATGSSACSSATGSSACSSAAGSSVGTFSSS
jgi:hypothetical protein